MGYFVIIRGPLGIGKSTLSKKLTKILKGNYISMDKIVDKNRIIKKLDKNGLIDVRNFIHANTVLLPVALKFLKEDKPVTTDGCFYHKEQIVDLINRLKPYDVYIFDLKAPVDICIERDKHRKISLGEDATRAVYNAVSRIDCDIKIDTLGKTPDQTIKEILKHLPRQ